MKRKRIKTQLKIATIRLKTYFSTEIVEAGR